jgi:hypothetical protein
MSSERNEMTLKDGTYRAESDGMGGIQISTSVHMGKGYWVSEYGGVEINGITVSALKDALTILDIEPMEYVGIWTDTDTNITYVDRSHHFIKKQTALDLAKHWEQLAIWDCANQDEVRVA